MRIIGNIEHPVFKITVFKTDNRLSIKFEYGLMEQVFKFREGERIHGIDDVRSMVDKPMLDAVAANFRAMIHTREQAISRLIPPDEASEFDKII